MNIFKLVLASVLVTNTSARFRQGWGHGGGSQGNEGGGGMSNRDRMELIHKLFDHRHDIHRDVGNIDDVGIEATTYSYDRDVGTWIQSHVYQMVSLMENGGWIRGWDDLFRHLFDHRHDHTMQVTNTTEDGKYGVEVVQMVSSDVDDDNERDCIAKLIQDHAEVVTRFLERGRREMNKNHPVSGECD